MYKFRVHHIMCTNLYQGYGYSGAFCENMTRMVQWLNNNPNEPLMLTTNADDICASCPNLVDNKYCEDENNHVHLKDSELLLALQLEEGMTYTYSYLKSQAKIFLSKEIFEKAVLIVSGISRDYADTRILNFRIHIGEFIWKSQRKWT